MSQCVDVEGLLQYINLTITISGLIQRNLLTSLLKLPEQDFFNGQNCNGGILFACRTFPCYVVQDVLVIVNIKLSFTCGNLPRNSVLLNCNYSLHSILLHRVYHESLFKMCSIKQLVDHPVTSSAYLVSFPNFVFCLVAPIICYGNDNVSFRN